MTNYGATDQAQEPKQLGALKYAHKRLAKRVGVALALGVVLCPRGTTEGSSSVVATSGTTSENALLSQETPNDCETTSRRRRGGCADGYSELC
mmetsp:Transcript_9403/g.28281  ORF Transcript_9403/g.28281 Transcript_9403/m.28281 type:complete len:93 (+) Transcript_9403:114-392(+)